MGTQLRTLGLSALMACAAIGLGQANTAPTVTLKVNGGAVAAAKPFKATLSITFADGLHAYQNPASSPNYIPVTVKAGDRTFSVLSVSYPKGTPTTVQGEPKPVNIYAGTVKIVVTLKAPAKLGKTSLKLSFGYQQCNESSCFPPGTVDVQAPLVVAKTVKPAKAAS